MTGDEIAPAAMLQWFCLLVIKLSPCSKAAKDLIAKEAILFRTLVVTGDVFALAVDVSFSDTNLKN